MNEIRKYTAGVAFGCVLAFLAASGNDSRPAAVAPAPPVETPPASVAVESPPLAIPATDVEIPAQDSPHNVAQDSARFVHQIAVHSGLESGIGSATHIGGGVFLTCKHLFSRQVLTVDMDGQQYGCSWRTHPTLDFAVLSVQGFAGDATTPNTADLSDGQPLRVVGQKTGLHEGTLSPQRWSGGYRVVESGTPTESGDSGAGVFNDADELVGVHWGSNEDGIFFTPLREVADFIAEHTGTNAVAVTPAVTPFTPAELPSSAGGSEKPKIRILSPATWDCGHCPGHQNQDWSGFDVTFEKRDGLPSYPATEWVDARGVTRRLYGQRTPAQVLWSWKATQ